MVSSLVSQVSSNSVWMLISGRFLGATHLLLSRVGLGEQVIDLLSVLLPVVASTLVVLDVSSNLMLDFPPFLARCHSLEELNLSENPLISLPCWMGELTNLRMLIADGCGLKSLPEDMIKARLLHTICGKSAVRRKSNQRCC